MTKRRKGDGRSYDIGYKKPPVETRWQPGQSGNLTGRKRGAKNLLTIARELVNEKVLLKENGNSRKVTYAEALLRAASRRAANGDKHSIILMLDLIGKIEAEEQRRAAQRDKLDFRIIDSTMTAKEAADAYAESLAAIKGLLPGADWEVE